MLGPIIVSSVAVGLPVVAGLWLAPRRDSRRIKQMLINRFLDNVLVSDYHNRGRNSYETFANSKSDTK
jgi:hypothetical protein